MYMAKQKRLGWILKVLLVITGVWATIVGFGLARTTMIGTNGIVTYVPENLLNAVISVAVLVTYSWTFIVFIRAGISNPKIRTKLFLMASGFLLGTWSGAVLILAQTVNQYLVIYAVFFLSYLLQLLGVLEKSEV